MSTRLLTVAAICVPLFLLADDELRESVRRWGAARRAGASGPVLAGVQGARVAGFLRGL